MAAKPRGKDWRPTSQVSFEPVAFKLLQIADPGNDREIVGSNNSLHSRRADSVALYGDWHGVPFDPWRKGDLVVLCVTHRAAYVKGASTSHETWHVMRRASTPAHKSTLFAVDPDDLSQGIFRYLHSANASVFRIAYRWHHAAHRLLGREFESREALEAALASPASSNHPAAQTETTEAFQ